MMTRRQLMRGLGWTAVITIPFAILILALAGVTPDPVWQGTNFHFLIVSLTSFIALFMAIFMLVAASQLNDARVVFLSLAFLGIAGIFSVHGLTTPGALVPGMNPWIGFCAHFAMLVGAFFFALSTVEWRPAIERRIVAWQRPFTLSFAVGLVAFAFVALGSSVGADHSSHTPNVAATSAETHAEDSEYGGDGYGSYTSSAAQSGSGAAHADAEPGLGRFGFLVSAPVERSVTFATLLLSTVVIYRYFRIYRLSRIPLVTGFLVSAIFLFQAQFSLSYAPTWHASWWLYHVLLLGAFTATLTGMIIEYSHSGSLRGVVEGLLLRDTITQLQRGYAEVIVALVGAVEAKDVYTRGHTQRVSDLSVRIGQELKLPHERLRVLSQAAMLHDIGKIGVPDSILNKPGPLTLEEFATIQEHPARGHSIIKDVRSLQAVVGGVRHHHERLDGSGYPDGLVGEQIPLEARIIAVADVYDALTSLRPYRPAWSRDRALAVLDEQAGAKLDEACVQALHAVLARQRVPQIIGRPAAAAIAD
jgi:hypothetical protein